MDMLWIIKRIKPIGSEEWQAVTDEHNEDFPGRSKESLMKKYATLYRKKIPTGDPNCPEEVKLAKQVKYLIGQKAAVGDGEEEFNLEQVEFSETGANPNPNRRWPTWPRKP